MEERTARTQHEARLLDAWLRYKGVPPDELAVRVGVSRSTAGRWLKGQVPIPTKQLKSICTDVLELDGTEPFYDEPPHLVSASAPRAQVAAE